MSNFPALDEFESFGGADAPVQDVDSFLARERDILGDHEFGGGPTSAANGGGQFPDLDDSTEDELFNATPQAAPAPSSSARFDISAFSRDDEPPKNANVSVTGNDDVSAFERQFPQVEVKQDPPSQPIFSNGYGASPYNQPAPTMSQPSNEPESDAVRAWREKQEEEIRTRDDAAQAKREETITKAERSIDEFYADYNAKKERQIAQNKEAEIKFLASRDDALAQGTVWSRIADLCDMQDSRSKTNTRSTRDLSRFKETLLSLKREGDAAPGAGGY